MTPREFSSSPDPISRLATYWFVTELVAKQQLDLIGDQAAYLSYEKLIDGGRECYGSGVGKGSDHTTAGIEDVRFVVVDDCVQ